MDLHKFRNAFKSTQTYYSSLFLWKIQIIAKYPVQNLKVLVPKLRIDVRRNFVIPIDQISINNANLQDSEVIVAIMVAENRKEQKEEKEAERDETK